MLILPEEKGGGGMCDCHNKLYGTSWKSLHGGGSVN